MIYYLNIIFIKVSNMYWYKVEYYNILQIKDLLI